MYATPHRVYMHRKSNEAPYHQSKPDRCWEQSVYTDTILSALAGRPLFYHCWEPPGEKLRAAWELAHQEALQVEHIPGVGLGAATYLRKVGSRIRDKGETTPQGKRERVSGRRCMCMCRSCAVLGTSTLPPCRGV